MSSFDLLNVESEVFFFNPHAEKSPSKCKRIGFAIVMIAGVGCLVAAAIGVGGLMHAGALSNLGQTNSIVMIVIGGGGGIPLIIVGIVGIVNTLRHNKIDNKNDKPEQEAAVALIFSDGQRLSLNELEIKKLCSNFGCIRDFYQDKLGPVTLEIEVSKAESSCQYLFGLCEVLFQDAKHFPEKCPNAHDLFYLLEIASLFEMHDLKAKYQQLALQSYISSIREIRTNKNFIPKVDWDIPPAATEVIKLAGLNYSDLKEGHHNPALFELEEKVLAHGGAHVCAHGIEVRKGGMQNLINIMLEGLVRNQYCGGFTRGDPSWSAGEHGPYYVLIDLKKLQDDAKHGRRHRPGMIDEIYHIGYVIPSKRRRKFLFTALEKAEEIGMLIKEEVQNLKAKVLTYKEFLEIPKSDLENKELKKHFQ